MLTKIKKMSLSTAFIFLSLAFLVLGLARGFGLAEDVATGSLLSEPIRPLGVIPAGTEMEITLPLKNSSERTMRIVGGTRVCTSHCCVWVEDLPVEIAAHSEKPIRLHLSTRKTQGEFRCPITLYTDRDGMSEAKLELSGRILP